MEAGLSSNDKDISPFDGRFKDIPLQNIADFSMNELAYIGDAIFELRARLQTLQRFKGCKISKLHREAVELVNCKAQSAALGRINDTLAHGELEIVRRARNASGKGPKNASPAEYMRATALEALLGYLFLSGNRERLEEILSACMENKLTQIGRGNQDGKN